jgi:predicted nuclease of predicted toxin-antitoxin system
MASKRKLAFLPDHNLPSEIIRYLSSLRKVSVTTFEAIDLPRHADDSQVIEAATKEKLLILTGDKRFTEDHIPLCRHEGIVKFEVSKPATRLRCLKRFMHMQERHLVWKGVARLYEFNVTLQQHNGDQSTIPYSTSR